MNEEEWNYHYKELKRHGVSFQLALKLIKEKAEKNHGTRDCEFARRA